MGRPVRTRCCGVDAQVVRQFRLRWERGEDAYLKPLVGQSVETVAKRHGGPYSSEQSCHLQLIHRTRMIPPITRLSSTRRVLG